jgi:small nuclear ribonucleoprotein D3
MATIPLILLREAVGHVVVVELNSKDEYRGMLKLAEESMNITLSKCTHTSRVGKKSSLEEVYLRGSSIRLFVLPDLLANAPVLKSVANSAAAATAGEARQGKDKKNKQGGDQSRVKRPRTG